MEAAVVGTHPLGRRSRGARRESGRTRGVVAVRGGSSGHGRRQAENDTGPESGGEGAVPAQGG